MVPQRRGERRMIEANHPALTPTLSPQSGGERGPPAIALRPSVSAYVRLRRRRRASECATGAAHRNAIDMFLSIATTHEPATDLGFLLMKHQLAVFSR